MAKSQKGLKRQQRFIEAKQARAAALAAAALAPPEAEGARQARFTDVPPASAPTEVPDATGPAQDAAQATADQPTIGGARPGASPRLGARFLAAQDPDLARWTLDGLSPRELQGLPHLWEFWAHPHQLPPEGDWRTWVILGGRGAGKTRAGAEWVRAQVEGRRPHDRGRCRRVALLAETIDQGREVMVLGDSGLLATSPPDRRPRWVATRNLVEWPNGATAQLFSAHEPESLRGPQFDAAWADELAKWKRGEEAWDQLQMGLRLGLDPRCVVTTTPRRSAAFLKVTQDPGTVTTHGRSDDNPFLAPGFLRHIRGRYGDTRLGRQELDGILLDEDEGALWTLDTLARARAVPERPLDRVVVAVDPAMSTGKASDATGIVVAGCRMDGEPRDWTAAVLEDATIRGATPDAWGRAAADAARRHEATRIVVEANGGGDMVADVLRAVAPGLAVESVHARQSKGVRAEPVAALYEQGRVRHAPALGALEDQMLLMAVDGFRGRGSPDRVDALVWALHALVIAPAGTWSAPRMRAL